MKNCRIYAFLIFTLPAFLFYSSTTFPNNYENIISEEINLDEILSDLPEGLNPQNMSLDQISQLPYFDYESAVNFIRIRDTSGSDWKRILSSEGIHELSPLQNYILSYLTYSKTIGKSFLPVNGSFRTGSLYNDGDSFSDSKYYIRLKSAISESFKFNIISERDRFEPRALDLFSANAFLKLSEYRTDVILGDYRPDYGQGLLFNRYSLVYSDGSRIINPESSDYMNSSFDESRFLRGFHSRTNLEYIDFRIWFSSRKLDASIDKNGDAVTIDNSGYHLPGQTIHELSEKIYGSRISFTLKKKYSLGVSGVYAGYSPPFADIKDERHVNYPSGESFRYLTFDGKFELKPLKFVFERAVSAGNGNAFTAGAEISEGSSRAAFSYRNFSRHYWAPHSGTFSAFGGAGNEKGFYSSFETFITNKLVLSASLDLAGTVSRTYTGDMPLEKRRVGISIKSKLKNGINWSLSSKSSMGSNNIVDRKSGRLRFNGDILKSGKWRSDAVWSSGGKQGGPYLETGLAYRKGYLNADVSTGIFDIPSYDARYYRYERDVPGRGYSMPVWGKGIVCVTVIGIGPASIRLRYEYTEENKDTTDIGVQFDGVF